MPIPMSIPMLPPCHSQVVKDVLEQLKQLFRMYDADGSGEMDASELRGLLVRLTASDKATMGGEEESMSSNSEVHAGGGRGGIWGLRGYDDN